MIDIAKDIGLEAIKSKRSNREMTFGLNKEFLVNKDLKIRTEQ